MHGLGLLAHLTAPRVPTFVEPGAVASDDDNDAASAALEYRARACMQILATGGVVTALAAIRLTLAEVAHARAQRAQALITKAGAATANSSYGVDADKEVETALQRRKLRTFGLCQVRS